MFKLFPTNNETQDRIKHISNNVINQAITRSMIQANDALNRNQIKDAHKFYRYALRLSEMHFGEQDSVVYNLRNLLKALDEWLLHNGKPPMAMEKQAVK